MSSLNYDDRDYLKLFTTQSDYISSPESNSVIADWKQFRLSKNIGHWQELLDLYSLQLFAMLTSSNDIRSAVSTIKNLCDYCMRECFIDDNTHMKFITMLRRDGDLRPILTCQLIFSNLCTCVIENYSTFVIFKFVRFLCGEVNLSDNNNNNNSKNSKNHTSLHIIKSLKVYLQRKYSTMIYKY